MAEEVIQWQQATAPTATIPPVGVRDFFSTYLDHDRRLCGYDFFSTYLNHDRRLCG